MTELEKDMERAETRIRELDDALTAARGKIAELTDVLSELLDHESPGDWPWSNRLWRRAERLLRKHDAR